MHHGPVHSFQPGKMRCLPFGFSGGKIHGHRLSLFPATQPSPDVAYGVIGRSQVTWIIGWLPPKLLGRLGTKSRHVLLIGHNHDITMMNHFIRLTQIGIRIYHFT